MSKHSIQNDPHIQEWIEEKNRSILKKSHAIKFAEFVSNDPVFDDFWSMSKEHQEEIYQQFLNQKKDE